MRIAPFKLQPGVICLLVGLFVIDAHAGGLAFKKGFEDPLQILMLEPPVVHQSFGVHATAHLSGLFSAPATVRLVGPGAVEVLPVFSYNAAHKGLLQIEIPTSLDTGDWDLVVERAGDGDITTLAPAFSVVDSSTIAMGSQPATLSTLTGGEIRLDADEDDFMVVPQVLLRPNGAPPSEPATRLQGVKYIREDRVFATVPAGLGTGTYDVIAINPDGTSGLISQGLVISPNAEPVISDITPDAFYSDTGFLEIQGSGFDPSAAVAMSCDGAPVTLGLTFNSSTSLTVQYINATTEGLCIFDLLNPDGQETAFAPLRRGPGSMSLPASESMANMQVARRAPGLALRRVDGESLSLYAMGGDDGATANAFDSVEIAEVDEAGDIGGWVTSRNTLPEGRTFGWATAFGDFLYLVGGNNGSAAVNSVLRAQVLDAAAAPQAIRHTILLQLGAPGFSGGLQVYRVSAVFPGSDPVNPNGESLAGDDRMVFVPNASDRALRLEWDPVPGASVYNIYTNPQGVPFDGDSEALELIASVAGTTFIHNGQSTDPATLPLLPGETGAWHQVSGWTLGNPRSHLAGAIAPLKGAPGSMVLYAMGGVDEKGDTLQSYEYSVISAATSAAPGYGNFANGTDSLLTPLRSLLAWAVNYEGTDDSWIFVGTGFDNLDAPQRDIERGTVSMTGDLGTLASAGSEPDQRAGASGFLTSDGLAVAGGDGGAASADTRTTTLSDSGSGPEMDPWNTVPPGLVNARIYPGTAQGSVFIYIGGGADNLGGPLSSVERLTR